MKTLTTKLFPFFSLILGIVFGTSSLLGQEQKEGYISYDMTLDPPPIFEQLSRSSRENLPQNIHHSVNVYFKDLWVKYEDTTLVIKQKDKTEVAYKNSEAGWLINQTDGMWYLLHQLDGKVYYAEEPLASQQWRFTVSLYDAGPNITTKFQRQVYKINDPKALRLTEETKTILGYTCKKGIYETNTIHLDGVPDNDGMVFWYTTALPSNISPIPCNLLNGAILELHAHRLHYTAKAVHFKKIENVSVALPQEGVKMTVGTEEKMIDRYMLQRD